MGFYGITEVSWQVSVLGILRFDGNGQANLCLYGINNDFLNGQNQTPVSLNEVSQSKFLIGLLLKLCKPFGILGIFDIQVPSWNQRIHTCLAFRALQ